MRLQDDQISVIYDILVPGSQRDRMLLKFDEEDFIEKDYRYIFSAVKKNPTIELPELTEQLVKEGRRDLLNLAMNIRITKDKEKYDEGIHPFAIDQ